MNPYQPLMEMIIDSHAQRVRRGLDYAEPIGRDRDTVAGQRDVRRRRRSKARSLARMR